MRWRLLVTPPLHGAENMGFDEALLERARAKRETVLRVYTWSAPTLSLGRNQSAVGAYDAELARARQVTIVRRLTGGRAVLHHREITYSVTAPAHESPALRESYRRINRLLLEALRRLGAPAELARPKGRTLPPGSAPCFEAPAEGEIVIGSRKLVGSAQWRADGALLQHGSILVDDDQGLVAELSTRGAPVVPPAATLRATLGRAPEPSEIADALLESVRVLEDPGAEPMPIGAELRDAASIAQRRYRDDSWTWRR